MFLCTMSLACSPSAIRIKQTVVGSPCPVSVEVVLQDPTQARRLSETASSEARAAMAILRAQSAGDCIGFLTVSGEGGLKPACQLLGSGAASQSHSEVPIRSCQGLLF